MDNLENGNEENTNVESVTTEIVTTETADAEVAPTEDVTSEVIPVEDVTIEPVPSPEPSNDPPNEPLNEPSNEPPKKSKKPLIIGGAVGALVLAGIVSVSAMMQTPQGALLKAMVSTQKDTAAVVASPFVRDRIMSPKYMTLTDKTEAKFDITLKNLSADLPFPSTVLNGAKIDGYFNIDEPARKLDYNLGFNMQNTDMAKLFMSIDDDLFTLGVPEIYAKRIAFSFSTLKEDIESGGYSWLGLPDVDYTQIPDVVFTMSSRTNAINKGNEQLIKSLFDIKEISSIIENAIKTAEVAKDEDNTVVVAASDYSAAADIPCKTYTVVLDSQVGNDVLSTIIDKYEKYDKDSKELIMSTFPEINPLLDDYYEDYSAADELRNIKIDGDTKMKFYVDKGNKIRRQTVEFTATDGDTSQNIDIVLDMSAVGKANIYDSIILDIGIKGSDGEFGVKILSNGDHAAKTIFTDESTITTTGVDAGSGKMRTTFSYDTSADSFAFEGNIEDEEGIAPITIGAKGTNSIKENSMTLALDEMYFEMPDVNVMMSANYSIDKGGAPTSVKSDYDYVEILKADINELMQMAQEAQNGYEALAGKVMGLFGM